MPQLQQFDPRWRAALASFIVQPGNPVRCPPLHCGCCLVPFIPSPPPPHCPTATQGAHDLRMAVWVPHCSRLSSIPCHVKRHSRDGEHRGCLRASCCCCSTHRAISMTAHCGAATVPRLDTAVVALPPTDF
eukprot:GGOE01027378.1.p3 GENE.GGOE01027378.1~~GGOE01027378.1.p3  ORF type:complete len:131 (-),score=2.64 GGOE01027378.1:90-482(-)